MVDLGTSQNDVALNLTELWRASVGRRPVSLGNPLSGQLHSKQLDADDPALSLDATRAEALRQPFAGVDRRLPRQPQRIKQYEGLQQNLKVAQTNLSTFLTTRETFRLEQAQNTTPWKVIAPPKVLPRPVAPSVPRNLAIGAVLGLVAGAAAALLRNRLGPHAPPSQPGARRPGPAAAGADPVRAHLQGVRQSQRILPEELDRRSPRDHRFLCQESFRNLFTGLRFLTSDQSLRSIAITSSLPAEGKSLVSVLLAKTPPELGQRVPLVDADLRKPQPLQRLGIGNRIGLSNLLTGGVSDTARALQPVGEHLDGLVLLVSLDRVDRNLPREAVERLRSTGAPLLGVVSNAVRQAQEHPSGWCCNDSGASAGSSGAAGSGVQGLAQRLARWLDGKS